MTSATAGNLEIQNILIEPYYEEQLIRVETPYGGHLARFCFGQSNIGTVCKNRLLIMGSIGVARGQQNRIHTKRPKKTCVLFVDRAHDKAVRIC